jgi:hypothetical protein
MGTRIKSSYEPMYEKDGNKNNDPFLREFKKIKPMYKVTNLLNNDSPQIHIEIDRSAKFCKFIPRSNNKTPKNLEEK